MIKKVLLSFILFNSLQSFSAVDYAVIKKIKGIVKVDNILLKVGDKVEVGKEIVTAKDGSYVDVELPQKIGILRLVGGSFIVESFNDKGSIINLLKGKLFSYFRSSKENNKNVIKTKMGSFGIRGTRLVVEADDEKSFLCVCDGKVESTNNVGITAILENGEYVYLTGDEKNISSNVKKVWFPFFHKGYFSSMGVLN